jgi:precorrin-3B synthase
VHQAADGALARVRIPGGMITPHQLEVLAHTSTEYCSGTIELTARGNIQLRGVTDTHAVAETVAHAGLLPSPAHERVRNIVSSPLSGRVGCITDVRPWVTELDRSIRADPALASLTGRFLFTIDDGRGDVSGLRADVGVQVVDEHVALLVAGRDTGIRIQPDNATETMLLVARRFAAIRGTAWRIRELDDYSSLLAGLEPTASSPLSISSSSRPPVGWITQDDGQIALGAAIPLGVLAARQGQFVAAIDAPIVITPWRSLLICDLDEGIADTSLRVLAPMGLVFDDTSPWLDVSACVGSPGCERSLIDVRAAAAEAVESHDAAAHGHYVGCERGCGSPPAGTVLVATDDGFRRVTKTADAAPATEV